MNTLELLFLLLYLCEFSNEIGRGDSKASKYFFFTSYMKIFGMKSLLTYLVLIILFIIWCFERNRENRKLREEKERLERRKGKLILLKSKKEHFKRWRDWIYKKSVPIAGAFIMIAFFCITYLIGSSSSDINNLSEFAAWIPVTEAVLIVLLWFKDHKVVELYAILNNLDPKMRMWVFGKRRINIAEQIQSHVREISLIDNRIKEINTILSV